MRATRYPLHAPVRYRAANGRWRAGMTESMSRSGLLLRVDRPLEPNTKIEMEVELPAVRGEEPARVICSGRIVRRRPTIEMADSTIVAATIARYRFDRQ